MPTLLLLRHARSTANVDGVLAGRSPGVGLDERGTEQAVALPARLAALAPAAVVTSPLERCRETLKPLLAARPELPVHVDERLNECDYGDWTGSKLAELAQDPLMDTVQQHPSAAGFPGGETMRAMQARAVEAVRDWNATVTDEHGPEALYVMCSHGDVIKSVVADALGMHLDLFQRIAVGPASVTAIRYTPLRPFVLRLGDTGGLDGLAPPPPAEPGAEAEAAQESARGSAADASAAEVGGGAGAG
ncbi:MSMEG_4193 family putative phosphomutase [Streptomyces sp. WMMC500]|uniref:histidine phosphatase family protein n=1 Tax=Streptomyces sp. WMMC500 TaxID=3015154 RepID=UPI00248CED72|nr:histidine phosphatase family protein [Streptomyces sp. WMMC500]WBB60310.1 MSMEG_4193 family putative phosphomutase [Streptomyces sp. WMMC500]